jgi:DNA-binding CsgD family transcriptional regulator
MGIQLQLLVIIMALISGVIAIIVANRMMRKYPLSFLSSYFYFLVFIYIFSVYSIIGSQTLSRILENHQTPRATIQSAEAMLVALGIPFLILAWFMFIRLSSELFRKPLSQLFIGVYFGLFAISFIGYALMNLDIGSLEMIQFFMDETQLVWTFTLLMLLVFGTTLASILINTRSLGDPNQRKAYQWFVLWYAVIISLGLLSLHFSNVHIVFGLAFVVVLTGFHLVPVVFLNIYLQRYYVKQAEEVRFGGNPGLVYEKYGISKRETEIIELICKGMSNQEISDSLFISLQTVKDHVHRIFTKTGVKNRVQLTNLVGSPDQEQHIDK